MLRQRILLVVIGVAFAGVLIGQAISQEEGRSGSRGGGGQRSPEEMRKRIEQWNREAAERLRTSLNASEEQWVVIQPRVEKVQTVMRQIRVRQTRNRFRTRGERTTASSRRSDDAGVARPQSAIEKSRQTLRELLEDEKSSNEKLESALKALRVATTKLEQELEKARGSLREVVNVRQEARLVLMGLLD